MEHVIAPGNRQSEFDKRSKISVVAIAGSTGGTDALRRILACLPEDFPASVLYVQHLNGSCCSLLAEVLQRHTLLKVRWARQGDRLEAGVVYFSPAGFSPFVHPDGTLTLAPTATSREVLHRADHLFTSLAASYAHRAVAIVLSGGGWDGSDGVYAVRAQHGKVLAQDESSALQWSMPQAAIATGCLDLVLRPRDIAPVLVNLAGTGIRSPLCGRVPLGPRKQVCLSRLRSKVPWTYSSRLH